MSDSDKVIEPGDRLDVQEQQYAFPYHYIPHFSEAGEARRCRTLGWGHEYLCYQYHIIDKVMSLNPTSVLEVGCGDGFFIGALGKKVAARVGADFSEKAIGFARAFHPDVRFHVGDAADIDQAFDVVTAIEVLEHIPDDGVERFLKVLFARVRPGGHVLISVPSVVLPFNKKHFRHYSADLLCSQVRDAQPNAELVSMEHICRVPRWMSLYNKLTVNRYWTFEVSAVSRWVWRKLWRQHRIVDANTGRHVVGLFRRPA